MRPLEIEYLWGWLACRVGAHRMDWVTIPFTTFTAPVCTRPGCHTRGGQR